MKTIQLNKGTLNLPSAWEDLTPKQTEFTFRQLIRLYSGELLPFQFQLALLVEFTGYKPSKKYFKKKAEDVKENINFNLIQLAEQINFAFTIQGNKILPNNDFKKNPFQFIDSESPYFNRHITVDTNITAKQFSDCLDLLTAYGATDDVDVKQHCLYKLFSVLYQYSMLYACSFPVEVAFGVLCWFTGIASFFQQHPVYSVLFNRDKKEEDDPDKINLGMNEIILYLKKEGYADAENLSVIDFFNAQIKSLKDSISHALGSGIKEDELSIQTGISITNIQRLS